MMTMCRTPHSRDSTPGSRLARLLTLLLLAVVLVACGRTSYSVEDHLERAATFEQQGDLRAAMIELQNALQMEPDRAEARHRLGAHYLAFRDGESAESELSRAVSLGDDSDEARLKLVRAWLLQRKFDLVIEETRLVDSFSSAHVAEALTLRGLALVHLQQQSDAEATFRQAYEMNSSPAEAAYGIAWVSALNEEKETARTWIEKALEMDPALESAWELLGDLEMRERRLDDAAEAYSRAIESSLRPISGHYKRALVRLWLEDYEGAGHDARRLGRLAPGHPDATYVEGLIQFEQANYDVAQVRFEEVLSRFDRHGPSRFYLGASHLAQGHWRQAEDHLNRYLTRHPESQEANRLLAVARTQDGDAARGEQAVAMLGEPGQFLSRVSDQQRVRQPGIAELEAAVEDDPGLERLEIALIMSYLQQNDHDKAMAAIDRLESRHPESPVPHNLRGIARLALADLTPAIESFEEALRLAPGDVTASLNLAQLALQRGDLTVARGVLNDVLEHHPDQYQALMQLAALEGEHAQNMTAAAGWLEKAVKAHPDSFEARLLLSRYYLFSGQPRKTLATAEPMLARHSENPVLLDVVARAQLTLGEFSQGLDTLAQLEALQPASAEVQVLKGNARAAAGEPSAARRAYERAVALEPDHIDGGMALVRLDMEAEDYEAADRRAGQLRASHPRDARIMVLQGELALEQGEFATAVQRYREAQQHQPAPAHLLGLARSQWFADQRDASIRTLRDWIEIHPEDVAARHRLANYLMQMGRDTEARDNYESLLERDPRNPLVLNNLAWLLREADLPRAIRLAERALEMAPDTAVIMDTLGMLYLEEGKADKGLAWIEQALRLAPSNPTVQYHYAVALDRVGQHEQARVALSGLLEEHEAFPERSEAESLYRSLQ